MATLHQTEHHPAQNPGREGESISAKSQTPSLPTNVFWALKYLWFRDSSAGGRIFGFKYWQKYLEEPG